jgi:hypothetical protein
MKNLESWMKKIRTKKLEIRMMKQVMIIIYSMYEENKWEKLKNILI